ncbi:MAG: RluA family pseudouridine synthase [Candidatus Peribacteraceae bacterium]|nr:RluA family pseudouridine synthase [Candidatus Peribacteraceae bacterium]
MPTIPSPTTVTVPMRLDAFLVAEMGVATRSQSQKFIKAGYVKIGKKTVEKPAHMLKIGNVVTLSPEATEVSIPTDYSPTLDLQILYEDDDCIVINKPAGLMVHAGSGMEKGEVTLIDELKPLFAERQLPLNENAVLVHRLDKETTGCILVAKNPDAHRALQKMFEKRTVAKTYLALVMGTPTPSSAIIDSPIGRHSTDRTKMSVLRSGRTREARTIYHVLSSTNEASLLACDLETGRTHQIRVHVSSIGHPILGDEKYYTLGSLNIAKKMGIDFLCLHAWKLSFTSPISKKKIAVEAVIPEKFQQQIELNRLTVL